MTSLVIDLAACPETKLEKYQLKYLSEDQDIDNATKKYAFLDMVQGVALDDQGFVTHQIPNRKFAFLFFNNESDKFSPKIQRALGGYINHNFYTDSSHESYMSKDQLVFTQFLSTGSNISTYISSKNPNLPIDKFDLEKINIESLPATMELSVGAAPVYFLEAIDGYKTMRIFIDESYDRVTVQHNSGTPFAPQTYNAATKSFYYTVAPYNSNLQEWLNEYVIVGEKWQEKFIIANMDIYFLTAPLQQETAIQDADKLHIVYIHGPETDAAIQRLEVIFSGASMGEYFLFEWYDDVDAFEGKLLSQDYDLVLRMVDLGQRDDLRSLFAGKNPVLNPSLYSTPGFSTALGQYTENPGDPQILANIADIYGKDMPFVVLGQTFDIVSIVPAVDDILDEESTDYVYDLHQQLYSDVTLGSKRIVTRPQIFSGGNVQSFIVQGGEK
jgi:hypothetical protein